MTRLDQDAALGGACTCPNAWPSQSQAALFGVVQPNGRVAYISPSIPVTQTLLEQLEADGVPIENRLRLTAPCLAQTCSQWGEGRCTLADKVVADLGAAGHLPPELPACGIRPTCRCFSQHGQIACGGCPEVIRKPAELYATGCGDEQAQAGVA